MTIDMSQFYQVFFEETAEHLAAMESLLLGSTSARPMTSLNAIFPGRAFHQGIKRHLRFYRSRGCDASSRTCSTVSASMSCRCATTWSMRSWLPAIRSKPCFLRIRA